MTIPRSLYLLAGCLSLTSACASRVPLPGPDPVAVRTTIEAQIAQSARAIPADDTMITSEREALRP
jgi:hypothetical protein